MSASKENLHYVFASYRRTAEEILDEEIYRNVEWIKTDRLEAPTNENSKSGHCASGVVQPLLVVIDL